VSKLVLKALAWWLLVAGYWLLVTDDLLLERRAGGHSQHL